MQVKTWNQIVPAMTLPKLSVRQIFWIGLLLITLFGVVQPLGTIRNSLNVDEPFSANAANFDWKGMFEFLSYDSAGATPLHYITLKIWRDIFGESEIALRSQSVLFFGLAIIVVGLTGKLAGDWRTGLIAPFLLTVSTGLALSHAVSARPYALLILLVSLAGYCYVQLLGIHAKEPDARARRIWFVLLTTVHVLGLLTHLIYLFFMCGVALSALWISRKFFINVVLSCAIACIVYFSSFLPLIYLSFLMPGLTFLPIPGIANLFGGYAMLWGTAKATLIVAYCAALIFLARRTLKSKLIDIYVKTGVVIFLTASITPLVYSQFVPIFVESRTPMIFLPTACILAALVMTRLGYRVLTLGAVAVLAAASIRTSWENLNAPDLMPARESIAHVVANAKCGDMLLVNLSIGEVVYYLRQYKALDCLEIQGFPFSIERHPGTVDFVDALAHPEPLIAEASVIVDTIQSKPGMRAWMFYPGDDIPLQDVMDILKTQMDERLTQVDKLDKLGTFFKSILVYE